MENKQSAWSIASVSWGKDSLAMLLLLIEKGYPLDEVVFYDTGMEFQAIYNTQDKMLPLLESLGIKYTRLEPVNPFLYDMLERPVQSRQKGAHLGYGWCGGRCDAIDIIIAVNYSLFPICNRLFKTSCNTEKITVFERIFQTSKRPWHFAFAKVVCRQMVIFK